MAIFSAQNLAFAFGILGNVISFFVFLSPLPTFYQICKKKSAEGFQSLPYVVGLFSAMLLMYYAFVKAGNSTLLITINSFGCLVETIYIGIFFYYASKNLKIKTTKSVMFMLGSYGLILGSTTFLTKDAIMRERMVGWTCLVFSVSVFVAPLFIVKQVIKTKSVEFMPFSLSLSLTCNAVMWFFYGLLIKDFNIAIPNVLGFIFGLLQMGLYWWYKDGGKKVAGDEKVYTEGVKKEVTGDEKISKKNGKLDNQVVIEMKEEEKKLQPHELAEQLIDIATLKGIVPPITTPLVSNSKENIMGGGTLNMAQPNISVPIHAGI
ncbi:bidirectional sugar transporter NEC1-like [Impatiens glandulifera]|uniref:bidirectional sugar transporter NEC1-like n=1 Tax=Impatiens glandulifera TaxID=253017 RepID=UPI001FB07941|nr:bidirectional sugar transporter NEC1-like [Impatiens glandulifera]